MLGKGKKTKAWEAARRRIKPKFEAAGITRCEFGYEGCTGGIFLSFVHPKKRADTPEEEIEIVALGCTSCHQKVERLKKAEMYAVVMAVINARENPVD